MAPTPTAAQHAAQATLDQLGHVILGKTPQLRLALTCLLAGGHLLLEDLPGVGKTTLAHALAASLGLNLGRVQFTSDLMPSDLTGVSVYRRDQDDFTFHPGPLFTPLLLADELNRATPKTQGALLEAMEERQITENGVTHPLPAPFFVIATQNPTEQSGTFPLPESQLDRFLMTLSLGYPDAATERALLIRGDQRAQASALTVTLGHDTLRSAQHEAQDTHLSDALLDYLQALLAATRTGPFQTGLSPRAALGLVRATRAHAWLSGRRHATPADVQAVFESVAAHRLTHRAGQDGPHHVRALIASVKIP
ncbi:MoxR family ATPase [Deinococcus soli (ex Cha et al. 2016)]|uniref:MoxR-like ATPase n=2 Tax=Deinococcus soli (ex Cha et al. 2016) TaxID=1309411 RepID=A0AAE4BM80_9DEIO|nr:MoxR family ATPase [Deinococcus soli (ex Cha et al. 2016)]MDR6218227.1 MoxR-like ATPase [Deinococcus soli (ex Cha et al. 2016)]MDR6328967.1 MoxR-like ATPase [Deinococcus soli (ex Cha et al. 2016)]MDR6751240.1 MoxR-like ATPase [Deinococcus soli (ex Cha et al. 2016)]